MVEEQANNLDMAETGVAGQQDREIVKWPVNNLDEAAWSMAGQQSGDGGEAYQ